MMDNMTLTIFLFMTLLCTISCKEVHENKINTIHQTDNFEQEKAAILGVLNDETKAAFKRDYDGWQEKWVHKPYITKTYMDFSDSSMIETLGWAEINKFVKTYIEEHPKPAPLPTLVADINVRLYGDGAWVSYEQNDAERGLKRETRLMEKVNDQWKIAGMHTTIYGFEKEEND